MIAAESLLVMNSLLETDGMPSKVQMVCIDPRYGIRYGGNFRALVHKHDVKDGQDDDLTETKRSFWRKCSHWSSGSSRQIGSSSRRGCSTRTMYAGGSSSR